MSFLESPRFNTEIRYGTVGGPEFNTDLITVTSGAEQRSPNWLESRGQWQVGDDLYTRAETNALIAFFRERRGVAGGFRFKGWPDWKATIATGVFFTIVDSDNTLQMAKKYVNVSNIAYRNITKPVAGTVQVFLNGLLVVPTPDIDFTTGIADLPAGNYSWSGEFDVPARFGTDRFVSSFEGYRETDGESLFAINGLTIVELKR
jgi:uncharacterized protein (TIGR02217 family)